MKVTYFCLLFFVSFISAACAQEPKVKEPYVIYDFSETRKTKSDHRVIGTQIFLTAGDYVGYRYDEDVLGSTTSTVKSIQFSNEYKRTATVEEKAQLVRKLLDSKVFELLTESKEKNTNYYGSFAVRIDDQEGRFYFYKPPLTTQRKAIHDIMLSFAKQLGIDLPKDLDKVTTITEGDLQPARDVKLSNLLANPAMYNGKRVSVIGFYHHGFEISSLAVDESAAGETGHKMQSIWRSQPSSFADKSFLNDKNNSWLRVEGVFLKGPSGHMGLWPGEIVRLTRIEPLGPPAP